MSSNTSTAFLAMYRKELRSIIRWTPLGIGLIAWMAWTVMPNDPYSAHQMGYTLLAFVGIGVGLAAVALALLQSIPETRADARSFLLHRPIPIRVVYWAKLLAGFSALMICVLPTLVVVAIHFRIIGVEHLPVSPVQVLPLAVCSVLIFFTVYPATLWTVYREARWFGTRWFPIVFGLVAAVATCAPLGVVGGTLWPLIWLCVFGVVITMGLSASLHAFEHQTFMPPASSAESMSKSRALGLAIASLLLVTFSSVAVVSYFRSPPRIVDYRIHELSLSSDGEIWETETHMKYINSSQDRRVVAGRLVNGEGEATTDLSPIADDWDVLPSIYVYCARRNPSWFQKFVYSGNVPHTTSSPATVVYDRVGRFYTYDTAMVNGSFNCITPRGVYDSDTVPEGRFRNGWVIKGASLCDTAGGELLIADENGVYQVKLLSRQVRKIIDGPVTGVGHFDALNLELDRDRDSLWTLHGEQAKRYEVEISEADEVTTKLTGQWTVDPKSSESPLLRIWEGPNGDAAFTKNDPFSHLRHHYQVLAADGSVVSEGEAILHENSNVVRAEYEILLVPPALLAGTLAVQAAFGRPMDGFSHPGFWVVIFLHSLVAIVIAVWVARSRRLSSGKTVLWGIVAGLLGVSMPLAMVAIYRKLTLEPCLECNVLRRVDQAHCESCGAAWEAPESDCNGIFEHLPEHSRSMASV